jgi:hypothetical protein
LPAFCSRCLKGYLHKHPDPVADPDFRQELSFGGQDRSGYLHIRPVQCCKNFSGMPFSELRQPVCYPLFTSPHRLSNAEAIRSKGSRMSMVREISWIHAAILC